MSFIPMTDKNMENIRVSKHPSHLPRYGVSILQKKNQGSSLWAPRYKTSQWKKINTKTSP